MFSDKGFRDGLTSGVDSMKRGGIEMGSNVAAVKDMDTLSDVELVNAKCNICNQDMFGTDPCRHWPGQTYLVDDNKVMCHALIYDQEIHEA